MKVSYFEVAQEHVWKASIYLGICIYAFSCAQSAGSVLSFRSIVGLITAMGFFQEVIYLIQRRHTPPGRYGLPFLGEIPWLIFVDKVNLGSFLAERKKQWGSIFHVSIPFSAIIMSEEEDLNWLFQMERKGCVEAIWPSNIAAILGPDAVANAVGERHKRLRGFFQPWFSPGFVKNYLGIIDETVQFQLDEWSSSSSALSSDVFKLFALRLFFAASFGAVDETLLVSFHDDFKIWLQGFIPLTGAVRVPGTPFDRAMAARERILETIDTLIDSFKKENPEGSHRAENTVFGRCVYASGEDGERLSRAEIKDMLLNLIFAGHDTTTGAFGTTLHHLAQHPEAKAALVAEVKGFKAGALDMEQLKTAPVLNAVIWESLRIDPPVLSGPRTTQQELVYKDYKFPKDTAIFYNMYLAANDPKVYTHHPEEFDFRRFLPKDHELYDPACWSHDEGHIIVDPAQGRTSYPIFGGGSRVCLGKHFALLELRVFLVRLFQQYDVSVQNDTKVWFPVNTWKIDFELTRSI